MGGVAVVHVLVHVACPGISGRKLRLVHVHVHAAQGVHVLICEQCHEVLHQGLAVGVTRDLWDRILKTLCNIGFYKNICNQN